MSILMQRTDAGIAARAALCTPISDSLGDFLCNLAGRWQDEREYEDWADYVSAMQTKTLAACPKGTTFVRATKRPFACVARIPGMPYDVEFSTSGWKSITRK